ncbi:MAG: hypothetical protein NC078_02555 [Ruminococcus sp.]|nr:hypothetical protein [Ruminococcus sp.]
MNKLIKDYAKISGVKLWQIAEELGMQDTNFSKRLRHTLSSKEEQEICHIIDRIAARNAEQKGCEEE